MLNVFLIKAKMRGCNGGCECSQFGDTIYYKEIIMEILSEKITLKPYTLERCHEFYKEYSSCMKSSTL